MRILVRCVKFLWLSQIILTSTTYRKLLAKSKRNYSSCSSQTSYLHQPRSSKVFFICTPIINLNVEREKKYYINGILCTYKKLNSCINIGFTGMWPQYGQEKLNKKPKNIAKWQPRQPKDSPKTTTLWKFRFLWNFHLYVCLFTFYLNHFGHTVNWIQRAK